MPLEIRQFLDEFEAGSLILAFDTLAMMFERIARHRRQQPAFLPHLEKVAVAARTIADELEQLALKQHRETAAWIPCLSCGEAFCQLHDKHVADCACPPIEEWTVDPYLTGGRKPS